MFIKTGDCAPISIIEQPNDLDENSARESLEKLQASIEEDEVNKLKDLKKD